MAEEVSASEANSWIHGREEVAVLDVREHGQYGEGHLLFASNCPYSRLEIDAPRLVPNRRTRCLICDGGDGLAGRAAERLAAIGYCNVSLLKGGAFGWRAAGFGLFRGVNVPSKAFGELVEAVHHTPTISADRLDEWRRAGRDVLLVDARPFAEFAKMSIPSARCVPNGELLYRLRHLVKDTTRPIVINCAGRTRGLIGAQSLINAGIPNPVFALENGTQGWTLSGRALDRGRQSPPLPGLGPADIEHGRAVARELVSRYRIPIVEAGQLAAWRAETDRTLYLLDVRTEEEYAAGHPIGSRHAPAVQLVQATDEWVAVRRARLAVVDDNGLRATTAAFWLRQMGHDAVVVNGALADLPIITGPDRPGLDAHIPRLFDRISAQEFMAADRSTALLLDLRPSMSHRKERIPGSCWTTRALLDRQPLSRASLIVLIADDPMVARLAALDIAAMASAPIRLLDGGLAAWVGAGGRVEHSPQDPSDAEAIDFLFFVHDRHQGNLEASQQYIAWETGLVDQLDECEKATLRPLVAQGVQR